MIDIALLRIIKNKEQFDKVFRYIPNSAIDKRTKAITEDIRKYFAMNPDEETIDFPSFRSLFFTTWHKGLKKEDCDYYNQVLTSMEQDVPESVKRNIVNQLLELELATDLGNTLMQYEDGAELDLLETVHTRVQKAKESMERVTGAEFASLENNTLEEEEIGYTWHIPVMNEFYRNILGGDLYIIAARPGKGKTTFLTHLNAHLGQQMAENKVIVWFNNESRKERIMSRQIQSALQRTDDELRTLQSEGKLRGKYIEVMGRPDRVRVYDVHGVMSYQLEDILEEIGRENVGAIVFDMLDNVRFPTGKGDLREDQKLERMYQWARELGVIYNCPVFPTSQVSADGAGLLWPEDHMLKDSKTGKQGACDGIIMIGSEDDPLNEHQRGISMPKTKSKKAGMSDMRAVVMLDEDKGIYV